jgi:cyanophycinase-like exopeptidase
MHTRFAAAYNEQSVPAIAEHRREIAAVLDANDALLITGGDVAVLLNRMRLFDVGGLLADKPIIGWSAGAMVLAKRIVLYHDRMPQGRRDPEVLGAGLGLVSGYVVLPDPAGRLREGDRPRIGLMARRFAPEHCITLGSGSALEFENGKPISATEVRKLGKKGRLSGLRAA